MARNRKLELEQLEKRLAVFKDASTQPVPARGWIHKIRRTLNMTLEQLGTKMGMGPRGVHDLEKREANESVTLKMLKRAGEALDMQLVYGFVPKDGTVDELVDKRARRLAEKIVRRTQNNMELEDQGTTEERLKSAVEELSSELKREMRRSLWD